MVFEFVIFVIIVVIVNVITMFVENRVTKKEKY